MDMVPGTSLWGYFEAGKQRCCLKCVSCLVTKIFVSERSNFRRFSSLKRNALGRFGSSWVGRLTENLSEVSLTKGNRSNQNYLEISGLILRNKGKSNSMWTITRNLDSGFLSVKWHNLVRIKPEQTIHSSLRLIPGWEVSAGQSTLNPDSLKTF